MPSALIVELSHGGYRAGDAVRLAEASGLRLRGAVDVLASCVRAGLHPSAEELAIGIRYMDAVSYHLDGADLGD